MIYLTTGANGAGKTLCTLRDVRDKQVAEGRPVYFCGFDPKPQLSEWGWQKFEFRDWQSLPDGSIVIGDEAHNFMPAGLKVDAEPAFIKMLAEHRKRGFDFFLIDQHPSNISPFVRRLIGSPGWHRHLKRTFGAELVSELKWSAANVTCEKPGAAQSAEVRMRPFPKEVYEWYASAMIHTGKRSIPRAVYVAVGMLVAAVALAFVSYRLLMGSPRVVAASGPAKAASAPSNGLVARSSPVASPAAHPGASAAMSSAQYIESRTPRIAGLPQTAPAFDGVTTPVTAPYPAACVLFKGSCKCYTQQATLLTTSLDLCKQIVERGFFMEWEPRRAQPALAGGPSPGVVAVPDTPPSNAAYDGAMIASMRSGRRDSVGLPPRQ